MLIRFEVACETAWGQKVGVCGSGSLGDWDVQRCFVLQASSYPIWSGELVVPLAPLEFKFVLLNEGEDSVLQLARWESDGANRRVEIEDDGGNFKLVLDTVFGQVDNGFARRVPVEAPEQEQVATTTQVGAVNSTPRTDEAPQSPKRDDVHTGQSSKRGKSTDGTVGGINASLVPRLASGFLGQLVAEPSVMVLRLVRSKSALALERKYEVLNTNVLGSGMSGGVCVAKVRATGVEVALKTLPIAGLTDKQREQVLAEVQIQLSMDHPHICRLLEVFEEPTCLRLLLEKMNGPDLFEHWSRKGTYSERDAAVCVRQICSAVAYCHSKGVCHRDLKLENFCLEDDTEGANIKMIDFGLSAFSSTPLTDAVGTLYYVAPEVLKGQYNEKCDMWSLGVLSFILLNGSPPFRGRDDRETFLLIRRGIYNLPPTIGEKARDFISKLLQVDVDQRLDAKSAFEHPWLQPQSETEDECRALDASVLKGMRSFARSNALKRAAMSVLAPVASAEEVSKWQEDFKKLDAGGNGYITVEVLVKRLTSGLKLSEVEAANLSASITASTEGEEISYSGFLAACLSAHTATLHESQLREMFDRLKKNADGTVSIEEIAKIVDGGMDLEELGSDLGVSGGSLTYDLFRWLIASPARGLGQILKVCDTIGGVQRSWKVDTILGKYSNDEAEAIEAKRRENAAWRMWYRDGGPTNPDVPIPCAEAENAKAASTARRSGKKNPDTIHSAIPGALTPDSSVFDDRAEQLLGMCADGETQADWRMATAAARLGENTDDSAEAVRMENWAWRRLNIELRKKESAGRTKSGLTETSTDQIATPEGQTKQEAEPKKET